MLVPTILCGGAGSRLWPVSREMHPKPFIRLADGETLLQKCFLRGARLPDVENVLTVTGRDLYFKTVDEFQQCDRNVSCRFILEPFGRNTAAAVATSALYVARVYGEDAVQLVLAADQVVRERKAFADAVAEAVVLARQGRLVTFGIRPDAPEIGYGYIEADGNTVVRFVEKPTLETAEAFLKTGRFLWNSGMFCFTAGAMLRELAEYAPDILAAAKVCLDAAFPANGAEEKIDLSPDLFDKVPSESIDVAVMEKSDRVAVVPCEIGWSDVGSWTALGALSEADENGNRLLGRGEVMTRGVHDCFVRNSGRLIGLIGIEDLIVVDTPDALLIAHKDRAQDVKLLFNDLKKNGHEAHKLHRTVHRPWGTYTVLEEGERYKIKRITVRPGASLSLQAHHHRSEHWIVVSGMAKVVNGDKEMLVGPNESTYIPAGCLHRLENPGILELSMIEVQSGEYLGEDDIVRIQDVYGRC